MDNSISSLNIQEITDYTLPTQYKEKHEKKIKKVKTRKKGKKGNIEEVKVITRADKHLKKGEKKDISGQNLLIKSTKKKGKNTRKKKSEILTDEAQKEETVNSNKVDLSILEKCDMSAWKNLFVPEVVMAALADSGFTAPTPIQALALPSAIRDKKDIVGAAETGSGKTLAFGIPLIHHILRLKEEKEVDEDEVPELVPIGTHWDDIEEDFEQEEEGNERDDERQSEDGDEYDLTPTHEDLQELKDGEIGCVHVETFDWLEEMETEEEKTKKRTNKPLYALILCPTRELAIQVKDHLTAAAKFTDIKIAAVVGGMAVQKQTRLLRQSPEVVVATPGRLWELFEEGEPHLKQISKIKLLVIDEADRMVEKCHFQELSKLLGQINADTKNKQERQTFVFSATLTFVPSGVKKHVSKKKKKEITSEQKLDSLMEEIGIQVKPKVIDLTKKGTTTAETLVEARINCSLEEKDIYLYYFLKQYPGRTLVFTNSKDCIRRLVSIFTLLETCPLPLHADMHQKQRLKNLDRFKGNSRGLLLATDVAARGLDIPNVQHVIHYQVPRTIENYVHRSGRTARAYKEGLSVMLVSPDDLHNYRKICKLLNNEEDLPLFPVEQEYIPGVQERINLARSIDKQELRVVKIQKQNTWYEKAAKEMDMEIDEDLLLEDLGDSRKQAEARDKIRNSKLELKNMLKQPLLARSYSGKYITQMGKLYVPYMKETSLESALSVVKEGKKIKKHLNMLPTGVKRLKKAKAKKKKRH